jgi:hypothetical protein
MPKVPLLCNYNLVVKLNSQLSTDPPQRTSQLDLGIYRHTYHDLSRTIHENREVWFRVAEIFELQSRDGVVYGLRVGDPSGGGCWNFADSPQNLHN